MATEVSLVREIRGISTYSKAIDTSFTELVPPTIEVTEEDVTVERFFEIYEQLFFNIPTEGEINSHKYLVERSTQYLGGSIFDAEKAALVEEINALRQQLLELGNTYDTVNNITT
jgi:hypothetical protein